MHQKFARSEKQAPKNCDGGKDNRYSETNFDSENDRVALETFRFQ